MSTHRDANGAVEWYATPLGQYLLAREHAYFDQAVADVFGYNAFQLGMVQHDLLRASRIPLRVRVDSAGPVHLKGDFRELPIATNSADLVVLPHTLEFSPSDKSALEMLRTLKAAGIPTVSVFLSGRPMWVNPELNASDAFVAAFLPGGEGGGIADVLFRDAAGKVRHDFHGKLSYSWPKRADQTPLNRGDADYDPLFAYGYGLTYADNGDLQQLSEERPAGGAASAEGVFFARGALATGWSFVPSDGVTLRAIDRLLAQ